MARKLNAELWDKMHYLFRDFNDRMVHVELRYDYEIDIEALKTVLICFFEKAPVLHSSFTDNRISPYWTVKDYKINDVLTVKEVSEENLDQEINDFLVQYIPPDADIQMKVAVFNHSGKSVLCIVENHMCMDGGDLKYFMKSLCKNYSDFVENGISPVDLRTGTRSYESVYEDFSSGEKRLAKNLYKNVNSKDDHGFPFTPNSIKDKSFIAKRKIPAFKFDAIRSSGKKHGATINDMILTAYFYSLYELAGFDKRDGFSISCAVDLRRHIKDNSDQGVTNHTAWMQCRVPEQGDNIFETLNYVVHSSNQFKEDRFAMSNIGVLEVDKLALAGNEPTDGFMSGAVKYKPFALLSVTSVRKELTLSMCVRGNEIDKEIVEKFFDLMVKNIDLLSE